MGIKGLTALLSEHAPKAITVGEIVLLQPFFDARELGT
jgi:hypothetical protein